MNRASESILIVDDDTTFAKVLADALKNRGYVSHVAHNSQQSLLVLQEHTIDKVLLDLNIGNESGLSLLPKVVEICPSAMIVVLTGYSSIATAVEAIKLGAINYLCKPADTDEILAAFCSTKGDPEVVAPELPPSVDRIQWEHIQKVLLENDGNISATARSLGMHRRTLQRKLKKRPVLR